MSDLARRRRWWAAALVALSLMASAGCASRDPWEDARIESEVKARLVAQKDADLTRLGVVSRKGVVSLSGTVGSSEQKEQAAAVSKDVRGVRRVVNAVAVRSDVPSAPPRSP